MIIRGSVHHQGCSTCFQHVTLCALCEASRYFAVTDFSLSIRADCKVIHIAGVRAFGIIQSVLPSKRVEVASRGGEFRSFASAKFMDVNCMFAGGQSGEIRIQVDCGPILAERGVAHHFPRGVLKFCGCFGEVRVLPTFY